MKANYFKFHDHLLSSEELEEYKQRILEYDDWIRYGNNRFAIYCSMPAFTADSPEMKSICNRFLNPRDLIRRIEYNYVEPMAFIFPHTDNNRNIVINVPVFGDFKNSYLDFYETNWEDSKPTEATYKGEKVKSTGKTFHQPPLLEQVNYTYPICFDSQEAHGVSSYSKERRYIITISLSDKYTFSEILRMYNQGKLIRVEG